MFIKSLKTREKIISIIIFTSIGAFCITLVELFARNIESRLKLSSDLINTYHPELGWLPKKNTKGSYCMCQKINQT